MKYFKYRLVERISSYETETVHVLSLANGTDTTVKAHQIAQEDRGCNFSNWDERNQAYDYGEGLTFLPELVKISKKDFDVLRKHL